MKKILFFLMVFFVVGALFFEALASASLSFFILGLLFLWKSGGDCKVSVWEKWWIYISLAYAFVFIMSFLLRPPYLSDGIWRLSSPVFILLLLVWFIVMIRNDFREEIVKYIAISIAFWGVMVLLVEWWEYDAEIFSSSYKLGQYIINVGATGFIIPLGLMLSLVALLSLPRNKSWIVLTAILFLLVIVIKKRTPLVMLLFTIIGASSGVLIKAQWISIRAKVGVVLAFTLLVFLAFLSQKDTIHSAYNDFVAAKKGDYMTSLGLRYEMAGVGIGLIKEKPLIGWGPNAYKSQGLYPYTDKMDAPNAEKELLKRFTHLHNQYLMDWVLSGVIGFVTLVLFLGYPIFVFIKWARVAGVSAWVAIGGMIGIWFVMLFGALFTYTYTTIAYFLVVSSLIALASKKLQLLEKRV